MDDAAQTVLDRAWSAVGWVRQRGMDMLYPPQCVACGKAASVPHGLCPACWGSIRFITRPFCERLGTPFAVDLGGTLISPAAMADPPVYQRARAVAAYEGTARELVHRLKFNDQMALAIPMARMMRQAGAELIADANLIIPVPSHRWRLFRRRFNQSAELARRLATETGLVLGDDILIKHKSTAPQTRLSKPQRRENISGAFSVPKSQRHRIKNKHVLLVDDVITTGSTANVAARVLLRAGAASVDVIAFGMVVNPG
jgi:ComF family protein